MANKDKPAILNVNIGTTVKGAVDDLDRVRVCSGRARCGRATAQRHRGALAACSSKFGTGGSNCRALAACSSSSKFGTGGSNCRRCWPSAGVSKQHTQLQRLGPGASTTCKWRAPCELGVRQQWGPAEGAAWREGGRQRASGGLGRASSAMCSCSAPGGGVGRRECWVAACGGAAMRGTGIHHASVHPPSQRCAAGLCPWRSRSETLHLVHHA